MSPVPLSAVPPAPTFAGDASDDLLAFIDASPSPWHAVATIARRLDAAGFAPLDERLRWQLTPGGRYYVIRDGSSIIAFIRGRQPLAEAGYRIVGAHTDSPGLRLKPRPVLAGDGLARLAVEVYGGPILATFADRDLGLAGRVAVRGAAGVDNRLLCLNRPLARLPNLAIHMNREVNEQGLKFNKQTELPLIFGALGAGPAAAANGGPATDPGAPADACFRQLLGDALGVATADLLAWDLAAYDVQPGARWGAQQEFIASRQLDNLASCHAGLSALLAQTAPAATALLALFDHEEVGSASATGAEGSFIADVLARIGAQAGLDAEDQRRARAQSFMISADMAHAWQPNFPNAYEPGHKLIVNGGPAIKHNANQRYATTAATAARFMHYCATAGVPCQQYAHRSDLGCGSTIGPLVAAQLGIATVDVGTPLWAMHSARESAGAQDHSYLIAALTAAFADERP